MKIKKLKKVNETTKLNTPVFDVVEKEYEDLQFKPVGLNCKDWVMVIARDELTGKDPVCVFIKQTRWGCEHSTIEFPCGTVEDGEDCFDVAAREFLEETGIKIPTTSLKEVAVFNPNPAYFNNKMHIFIYNDKNLIQKFCERGNQTLDENEDCEVFIARLSTQKTLLSKHAMGIIASALAEKDTTV